MRVKRYVVNTVPEALPAIRSELGKDAVILGTKEIYVGGFMGMFRKKRMEVIAAVESEGSSPPAAPQRQQAARGTVTAAYGGRPATQPVKHVGAPAPTSADPPAVREQTPAASEPPAMQSPAPRAVQPAEQPPAAIVAETPGQQVLMEEIREMKQMVSRWSRQQTAEQLPQPLLRLQARLREQEVAEEWIEKLIAQLQTDERYQPEAAPSEIWPIASRLLKEWLAPLADPGIDQRVRIIQFVGPTGVGKTTTIAKLAADQTLRNKRQVGFITSDTYRIAAVDQLRTYANILNVPMEVVFSPSELSKAFTQLADRDLIMVDTAGRNFRNTLYVSEVNSLLQAGDGCMTYLVLSLTGKSRDMIAVAEQFATFGVDQVIFTKRDETDTIGAILNVMLAHRYKPAFIAHGQTVPDDIEPFLIDRFAEQLLGEIDDE